MAPKSWGEFIDHRKAMKKAMSTAAERKALKQLERLREQGHDPELLLDKAILRGWASFFGAEDTRQATANSGNGVAL